MVRKLLFQLHLWSGLILGIVFVLIGLSGSIGTLEPPLQAPPAVQITAAGAPTLDKGLAAARAAVGAPQGGDATILLPSGSHDPVLIYFGDELPAVVTDPGTGRVLATYSVKEPDWFVAILDFHNGLLMPSIRTGRTVEGWLGLVMIFLGLTGLYLWWPKAGRWKYGFIVRRTAKGLRFHRELHGAVGVWALAIYLLVTTTGLFFCFAQAQGVLTLVSGDEAQHYVDGTPIVAVTAGAGLIGPDAALAAASKASDLPVEQLKMPGWKPGQRTLLPIIAQTGPGPGMRVYLNPYYGTTIPNPQPPPNKHSKLGLVITDLHFGIGFGPIYTVLVFISGLMPLVFFVTGLMMWLKKRKATLAMSLPLPESLMEQ